MKRVLALGFVGLFGCQTSDDGAFASAGDEPTSGTSDGVTVGGTTSPPSGTSGGGGTDTAPDPNGESGDTEEDFEDESSEGDSTGGPAGVDAVEPCEGVSCGGGGSCTLDADGHPQCSCPAGMLSAGLECLSCTAVEGAFDIDVAAADFSVNLSVAGNPPANGPTERAELWLRNPGTKEMISLGVTNGAPLHARVVPTSYELVYRRVTGAELPANRDAVVAIVDVGKDPTLELNLAVARLEGGFMFDGMAAPQDATDNGRVWLRGSAGDSVYLGETRYGSYVVYVLPGVYTIEYEALTSGETAPRNKRAVVGSIEVLPEQSEVAQVENIDVQTVRLQGAFQVDQQPAPKSQTERGLVSLRDSGTGVEFPIGETVYGNYDVRVVAGTYDVVYEYVAGANTMPANSHAVVGQIFAYEDNDAEIVNIATVAVSGAFLIDGIDPPNDASDDGRITLRNLATGDDVLLGSTTTGTFDRIVVAGQYTVHYGQDTSSLLAPANTNAEIMDVDVDTTPVFDVDVPTAFVSGLIMIGAGAPPDSDYDDGWVYLRNTDSGDTVLLANTRMGQFAAPVVPGTYEVVYAVETPGGQVPINVDSVVLDTVLVEGGTMFDIDIPVEALGGTITATSGAGERGSLYLAPQGSAVRSLLGNTADAAYDQPVIPGFYLVSYGVDSASGGLPQNTNAPLSCIQLVAKE